MPLSERPFGVNNSVAASVSGQIPLNQTATLRAQMPVTQVVTVNTETAILNNQNNSLPLLISIPPNDWPMEQAVFDLYASGTITAGTAASTAAIGVYAGSSTTLANNVKLGASTAVAHAAGVTAAWYAHGKLIYDSVSGNLVGSLEFYLNKTKVAEATLSNFPTGLNNSNTSGAPVVSFMLSIFFATANAGNSITVQRFTVG